MESEVTPGENEITVRGEGEALILLAAGRDPDTIKALPERLKPLGFGGEEHPDLFQVWTVLLERHKTAHQKAMAGAGEKKQAIFNRYLKLAIAAPEEQEIDLAPLENLDFPEPDPLTPGEEVLPGKR